MFASRRLARRALTSVLVLGAANGWPASTRADDASAKAVCSDKYQSAQRLRAAGKLTLARADLLRCADQSCPAFVSSDCKTWLAQVEGDLPTLVFAVLDPDGRDVPNAAIRVDGVDVPHATDGLGHVVDPGERSIDVAAGDRRLSLRIVARLGEKSRRVELRLSGPVTPPSNVTYAPSAPAPRAAPPVPVLAYVLGGVGVAAIGVGSILWATGSSAAHTYDDDCTSPTGCTAAQRTSVARQLVAGDLLWAAGLAAGVATVVIALQPPAAGGSAQVSVGTGGVVLSGAF
jgi:hypothetical protein